MPDSGPIGKEEGGGGWGVGGWGGCWVGTSLFFYVLQICSFRWTAVIQLLIMNAFFVVFS